MECVASRSGLPEVRFRPEKRSTVVASYLDGLQLVNTASGRT